MNEKRYERFWALAGVVLVLGILCLPLHVVSWVDDGALRWNSTTHGGGAEYELHRTLTTDDLQYNTLIGEGMNYRTGMVKWRDTSDVLHYDLDLYAAKIDLPDGTMQFIIDKTATFKDNMEYFFGFDISPQYCLDNDIRKLVFSYSSVNGTMVEPKTNDFDIWWNIENLSNTNSAYKLYHFWERSLHYPIDFTNVERVVTMDRLQLAVVDAANILTFKMVDSFTNGAEIIQIKVQIYKEITSSILVRSGLMKNQYEEAGFWFFAISIPGSLIGLHMLEVLRLERVFAKCADGIKFLGGALKWLWGRATKGGSWATTRFRRRGT